MAAQALGLGGARLVAAIAPGPLDPAAEIGAVQRVAQSTQGLDQQAFAQVGFATRDIERAEGSLDLVGVGQALQRGLELVIGLLEIGLGSRRDSRPGDVGRQPADRVAL